jgi:hypothetical protein
MPGMSACKAALWCDAVRNLVFRFALLQHRGDIEA